MNPQLLIDLPVIGRVHKYDGLRAFDNSYFPNVSWQETESDIYLFVVKFTPINSDNVDESVYQVQIYCV